MGSVISNLTRFRIGFPFLKLIKKDFRFKESKALYIGFFQVLALIPGMSRSGMTVSGGVFNGLSREQAARFSFLISIPIIGGSGCLKLIEAFSLEGLNFLELGVSSAVSFCAGLGAIYIFMKIVSNKNLWPFIWYRLGLAVVVIVAAVIG